MSQNCAICSATAATQSYSVGPKNVPVILCDICHAAATGMPEVGPHWQCLNDAIWSDQAAVQVLAYRLLHKLPSEPWARDVLDMVYLEPDVEEWAKADLYDANAPIHRDTNGVILANGDTVVLIKDLPVKGAGFTAKRGTAVRNISLVPENAGHIEGRVNDQRIVILTEFVKKS